MGNRLNVRLLGTRIKHQMGRVTLKMYKFGIILRIETTVNNVSFFRQYRKVQHRDGTTTTKWAPMKKTIYSLPALQDLLQAANQRYLKFISDIETPQVGVQKLHQLAETRVDNTRRYKGFRDRIVYLSRATVEALQAYLAVRGPAETDHVFTFRHRALSVSYFGQRLRTYSRRCRVYVTPHQLRHTSATLLLNAGAPILTVQRILGHKYIDTTLGYARLYDGTVAADYYRAMAEVEARLALAEETASEPPGSGELLAMVDALQAGTLNETQRGIVQALRAAILAFDSGNPTNDEGEGRVTLST